MATIGSDTLLKTRQKAFRDDFRTAIRQLASQLKPILMDAAGDDGDLTFLEYNTIQSRASHLVMRFFVGVNGQAFTEKGAALAPFGELFNHHHAQIVWQAVKLHHDWLASCEVTPRLAGKQRAQKVARPTDTICCPCARHSTRVYRSGFAA